MPPAGVTGKKNSSCGAVNVCSVTEFRFWFRNKIYIFVSLTAILACFACPFWWFIQRMSRNTCHYFFFACHTTDFIESLVDNEFHIGCCGIKILRSRWQNIHRMLLTTSKHALFLDRDKSIHKKIRLHAQWIVQVSSEAINKSVLKLK